MVDKILPQTIAEKMLQIAPGLSITVDILDDGRHVIREEEMEKIKNYFEKS